MLNGISRVALVESFTVETKIVPGLRFTPPCESGSAFSIVLQAAAYCLVDTRPINKGDISPVVNDSMLGCILTS
jgi:hypothetical protein